MSSPNLTWQEQNELYKTTIDNIIYTRLDEDIKIEITYK